MRKQLRVFAGVAAILLMAPLSSFAQSSCTSVLSFVSSGSLELGTARSNHPECFPASGGGTNQQTISATSLQQISSVSNSVNARFSSSGNPTASSLVGLPMVAVVAGNSQKVFLWANRNLNSATYNTSVNAFDSRTHIRNTVIGADYLVTPSIVAGISAAFDSGDGLLRNGRAGSTDSTDSTGRTVAPYIGWQISPNLTLDAMAGLGNGDLVQRNAELDTKRRFFGTNLTYTKWLGNLQLSGKGSYAYATERFSDIRVNGMAPIADSATTARLSQVRLGGQAGYWLPGGLLPYVGLAYSNDLGRSTSDAQPWDPIALVGTMGINWYGTKQGIAAGLAYTNELRREGSNNHTLGANFNVRF